MTCKLELFKNFPIKNYSDQVNFNNVSEQKTAMDSYVSRTFNNLSTVDLTKKAIRLNMSYYVGNQYNYGRLTYDTDTYYIFILSCEWLSNQTVILHFEYDYWQTYMFSIKKNKCMIEREHVSDDTFGKHLIDEGLPGFGVQAKANYECTKDVETSLCIAVSDTSIIKTQTTLSGYASNYIRCGYGYSPCIVVFDRTDIISVREFLSIYVENNLIDSIIAFYRAYIDENQLESATVKNLNVNILKSGYSTNAVKTTVPLLSTVSGYTPKNKKCLMFPFNYIKVSDCNGGNTHYHYELQKTPSSSAVFLSYFPPQSGGACYTLFDNFSDKLSGVVSGQSNIELPWISNVYSAYLSANQNTLTAQKQTIDSNLEQSRFNNIVNTLTSLATNLMSQNWGGVATSVIGGVQSEVNALYTNTNSLRNMNASLSDIQSKGDVIKGQFTSCLADTQPVFGFRFYIMQVSQECVKMADEYFEMNGYKVNRIGTPQWTSRKYWNFIKTVNSNITGNIPTDALVVINNMFDSGVTMWHDISQMYDYNKTNSIV